MDQNKNTYVLSDMSEPTFSQNNNNNNNNNQSPSINNNDFRNISGNSSSMTQHINIVSRQILINRLIQPAKYCSNSIRQFSFKICICQ
jgi:hypothetical protein